MDINGIASQVKGSGAKGDALARAANNTAQKPASDNASGDVSLSLSRLSEILNKEPPSSPEWGTEFKTIPPIPHTIAELQDSLNSFIEGVRERLSEIFADAGIELEQDVQIQANADGFSISAAESQLEQITNTLGSDAQMGEQLHTLQQRHQLTGLLNAASALGQGEDMAANEANFNAQRQQQEPLTLVIAANDAT